MGQYILLGLYTCPLQLKSGTIILSQEGETKVAKGKRGKPKTYD